MTPSFRIPLDLDIETDHEFTADEIAAVLTRAGIEHDGVELTFIETDDRESLWFGNATVILTGDDAVIYGTRNGKDIRCRKDALTVTTSEGY